MSGIIWRILLAVIAVAVIFALLPPLTRVLGLTLSSDVLLIINLCIGILAGFYILRGTSNPPWA